MFTPTVSGKVLTYDAALNLISKTTRKQTMAA
ncbi:MAG: hypothetical protein CFH36_01614 [Alphaproteobacteria bacterium MarineAlpha9_Bin6]|nr:MAG: hypothetical protein CFH36_01614 [Alphaproteobacteria bacterium MarineAlpha9_Bin6]